MLFLPPSSSNLNSIEKYWSVLKREVAKRLSIMEHSQLNNTKMLPFIDQVLTDLQERIDASAIARSNYSMMHRVLQGIVV